MAKVNRFMFELSGTVYYALTEKDLEHLNKGKVIQVIVDGNCVLYLYPPDPDKPSKPSCPVCDDPSCEANKLAGRPQQ